MAKLKHLSSKRREKITKSIRKAAKKHQRKYGSSNRPFKVQTAPAWKRIIIMLVGLGFAGLAYYGVTSMEGMTLTVVCSIIALILFLLAIEGDKKTIDGTVNGLDGLNAVDAIIEGLF